MEMVWKIQNMEFDRLMALRHLSPKGVLYRTNGGSIIQEANRLDFQEVLPTSNMKEDLY